MKYIILLLFSILINVHGIEKQVTLSNDNHISITTDINDDSINDAIKSLTTLGENRKNIYLYIDSPGGSVHDGNRLIEYINYLQFQNITVDCIARNAFSD